MKKNQFVGKKQVMRRRREETSFALSEIHKIFITTKKSEGLRERTLFDHKKHFEYFSKWLEDMGEQNLGVSDLNIDLLREYVSFMQDKDLSPVTINVRLRTLRTFLRFLYEEEYITANLAQKLSLMRTDEDTIKILEDEHVEALIKAIDKKTYTGFRDYVAIAILIDCGLRISELASLTTNQIHFDNSTIYLPSHKVKNRRGRNVPLSLKVNKLLFQLVTENSMAFEENSSVFLSVYGTPFQASSFRKRLKIYQNLAGIKGVRVSPHSFRHYFAKNYILSGGDPFTLQLILGHSDMQVVRRYIQMNDKDIKIKHNQFSPFQRFK